MYQKTVLPNGVRVVTEEIDFVRSVAIGIWIGAGSRNETAGYEGISHFIEHMLFKGTQHRSARQLAEALEAVGGQLNAFTTKEATCIYAKVLDENLDTAVDVLTDMFFHSLYDPKEIEKEKNVVLEEIKMYEDSPDELIHDLFSKYVWDEHALGKSILGESETVEGFTQEKIREYLTARYTPDQVVIAVAGKMKTEDVLRRLAPFGEWQRQGLKKDLGKPKPKTVRRAVVKDVEQLHLIVGVPGLRQEDDDIYALHVINNILGGGLSSRLFQEIREQRGLVYTVYSYHSTYEDTGLLGIYAGTSPANGEEVVRCILSEVQKMKEEGITEDELAKTKAQIKGNLYLGLESANSIMSRLGKTELSYGRVKTAEESVAELEKVTLADIRRTLDRLWVADKISIVTLGKKEYDIHFDALVQEIMIQR